jgi:glycoprotein endo-alpha-1,2-mannosidase
VRWTACATVVVAALVGVSAGDAARDRAAAVSPQVGIFYYAWWGTPKLDGAWLHWGQGQHQPPQAIGSTYYPARGPYSSGDRALVRTQMREIAAMGIDTVIYSWWGPGSIEDKRLRPVAAEARRAGLRISLHVEPWGGRTPAGVVQALREMRDLGIRDAYVYDSIVDEDATWRAALAALRGVRVFAQTTLPGKARKGGFQGLYSYDVLVHDGRSFRRMCKSARRLGLACAPSVGPGFDAYRATGETRLRKRNDGRWYDHMWASALGAAPDVVTITSYNEWHEGTQIEPARATTGPYATYEGAWGLSGKGAESAYLERTAYWVTRLRRATQEQVSD